MRLLKRWYSSLGLPLFLVPYTIISNRTGEGNAIGGILQVVPQVSSRDQLGKNGYKTLKQYFLAKFGDSSSLAYHKAIHAFISSLAAYNIVCYLLHIKDRHNGNILIDSQGHLVHIDFGFILGISPGKNMGFETAPFKLSAEMVELIESCNSSQYSYKNLFHEYMIQGFLAARQIMNPILSVISIFADSDLPCFQYKENILMRLRQRFVPELTPLEARNYFLRLIQSASASSTTSMYDGVQKLQNNIYSAEWR
jgi:phosphatidylinositol 4-kinase